MAKSIVLTTLSVFMGLFFIFVGSMKITPNINREMHREIRRNFVQYAKVFPSAVLFALRVSPKWLRLVVGWVEVCCGTTLLLIPGHIKQLVNVILLVLCLGAVYTHAMLKDPFERMAPALFFTLLLGCRLVVFYQVRKRELKAAEKLMERQKHEEDLRQNQDVLRRMQEAPWQQTPLPDDASPTDSAVPKDGARKDSKKNRKKGKKED
ncbi:transmembrane protein 35-like [Tropilaelaps mercedesae]|uniref:Novel acetylcholine receptor chaperone n=1 Tax=Tropilaelaps mercedesae TaxID=418985 RepID=A0A1V9XNB4_9ACAR|nr:transmembrane protein 35-like [Tropilaelaps mercedesae]